MRSLLITRLIPVIAALLFGGSAPAAELLTIEAKIPLGAVKGRIDHLAADLGRHRVFIAELGNNTLGVVDIENKKVIGRITGLKEPQGVAYAPRAAMAMLNSNGYARSRALARRSSCQSSIGSFSPCAPAGASQRRCG
jgi:YVTN family beta-propeller protein